jgi:putative oxidoreductase
MKINFTCDLNLRNILRWGLGLILVWAAVGKLANLQEFYALIAGYQLPLPDGLLRTVAICLPWMELLCGLLLLAAFRLNAGLLWALVLFFVFAAVSGQAWFRGLQITCGCLDLQLVGIQPGSKMAGMLESVGFAFWRALALMVATVYLLRKQPAQPSSEIK